MDYARNARIASMAAKIAQAEGVKAVNQATSRVGVRLSLHAHLVPPICQDALSAKNKKSVKIARVA